MSWFHLEHRCSTSLIYLYSKCRTKLCHLLAKKQVCLLITCFTLNITDLLHQFLLFFLLSMCFTCASFLLSGFVFGSIKSFSSSHPQGNDVVLALCSLDFFSRTLMRFFNSMAFALLYLLHLHYPILPCWITLEVEKMFLKDKPFVSQSLTLTSNIRSEFHCNVIPVIIQQNLKINIVTVWHWRLIDTMAEYQVAMSYFG